MAEVRRATAADLDELVRLHLDCFGPDDHVAVLLGPGFVRAMYDWFLECRWVEQFVVVEGDRAVASMSVAERAYAGALFRRRWGALVAAVARRPGLLASRRLWRRLFRSSAAPMPSDLAHVPLAAVSSESRGRGLFAELVEACEAWARGRGFAAIGTFVYRGNDASRRAFEKRGWREVEELGTDETVFLRHDFDSPEPA